MTRPPPPPAPRLTIRLDFDAGRRLGPGKIALLEAIARTGSISGAGRQFSMSYRRAWLLVAELNAMFVEPLVATKGGGRNGGGASLTPFGETLVADYRAAEARMAACAREEIERIAGMLAPVGEGED